VRGSVHAHAHVLALQKITGVEIEKTLPTPNINFDKISQRQKHLIEGSHRRLFRFSPDDCNEMNGIVGAGERGQPGELDVVGGHPERVQIHHLIGDKPAYHPTDMFKIASKPQKKSR